MKKMKILLSAFLGIAILFNTSCKKDDDPVTDPGPNDPGSSTTELVVKQFSSAPGLDGVIDEMWSGAKRLTSITSVPNLAPRGTYLNSDGEGIEEDLGLFYPYTGEEQAFTLRAGYNDDRIYFLMEFEDDDDSKDRQSWYFDPSDQKWKGEHKYANSDDDKFYEDKFAFLFPIGEVEGFSTSTCYATCHGPSLPVVTAKDKHTRHYLTIDGQKVDMWHWKRVRGEYLGQVDDQQMVYDDFSEGSGANGRKGDATGSGGYSNNSISLDNGIEMVSVPKYIIPGDSHYYWITIDEVTNGTAKEVTAIDANGVLTYDGGTLDPNGDPAYAQGSGNKRIPSVVISEFTEGRGDISIAYNHTGTGWICEFSRKLSTGDNDDVEFVVGEELPFGLAIFNNAAIAHSIKPGLVLKFE